MATSTDTPSSTTGSVAGIGIGAIAVAVLAALLAIYALGVSFATRNGTGAASTAAAPASAAGAPGDTVTVELTEFAIDGALDVAAGTRLVVDNAGAADHNLKVRDTEVGTGTLVPGASETLDLSGLAPGEYVVWCDIPGHATAGMETTLTVAADGEVAEAAATDAGMDHGAGMTGSASGAAMQAEMERVMQESIGSFPAETQGRGAAILEPEVLEDGTKFFELVVDEVAWEVEPGKVVDAIGYNGMVPGPTMNVDVGDEVVIRVTNQLDDQGTSLHPHGVKDHAFEMDGVTYISQDPIAVGDSMDYTFTMTEEAVATYHSHHMSTKQVPNGLFGALIVGDWAAISGFDDVVAEEVMILNDAGNIGFSLNGKSFPATTPYQYQQGDRVIVHYANEGQMSHPMHLHNQKGTVIAKDGYVLPEGARYSGDTFNVAPGERLTVVYEMDNVGTWVWHCHILSHVKRSDGSMFGMLTAVIVTPRDEA